MDNKHTTKTKKPLDPTTLYPTPKTYDQLQAQRAELNAKAVARQPKHIGLLAAAGLTAIFIYTLWFAATAPGMIRFNPIFGVFASFALGFIWLGAVYWCMRDINKTFYMKGFNPNPFYLVYAAWATLLLAAGNAVQLAILPVIGIASLHFYIVVLIMAVAYTTKLNNKRKIIILAAIWAAAFVGALTLYLQKLL